MGEVRGLHALLNNGRYSGMGMIVTRRRRATGRVVADFYLLFTARISLKSSIYFFLNNSSACSGKRNPSGPT